MLFHTLTIVGVGLIGGSIGLAAKKRGLAGRVIGVGRDPDKLEQARRLGAIDEFKVDLPKAVRDADLVVFCTPVDRIAEQIKQTTGHCKRGATLTDAGSTKARIVEMAEASLPAGLEFVGGHPLAGSEKKGCEHASADLFTDRWTILTPTDKTSDDAIAKVAGFWEALGARVELMSPREHDDALALTSHLPHLVASALAGLLPADYFELAATGFRDTTRIAAGDPDLWTPIFRHNRQAVLSALDQFENRLRQFRQSLTDDDGSKIDQFLAQGKKVRDALGS